MKKGLLSCLIGYSEKPERPYYIYRVNSVLVCGNAGRPKIVAEEVAYVANKNLDEIINKEKANDA